MKLVKQNINLMCALVMLLLALNVFAENEHKNVPQGFIKVKTSVLDKAWASPNFRPNDYTKVALELNEFSYRPVKNKKRKRNHNGNYELSVDDKNTLIATTREVFKEQLGTLKNYELVELKDADTKTLVLQIKLSDFVNKVPSITQEKDFTKTFLRRYGTATLVLAILSGDKQELMFKGYVRDDIEPSSQSLEKANVMDARHETKKQLKRWAKRLKNEVNEM